MVELGDVEGEGKVMMVRVSECCCCQVDFDPLGVDFQSAALKFE